jgi:hypothetical protein
MILEGTRLTSSSVLFWKRQVRSQLLQVFVIFLAMTDERAKLILWHDSLCFHSLHDGHDGYFTYQTFRRSLTRRL